jgi:hypothetical protein
MASAVPSQRELNPLVSRNAAREALSKALGMYVGYRGAKRRYTMADIEEFAGVKSRVVECVMETADSAEYRKIDIGDLLSLCAFLGQPFINRWLELSGYGAFELMDGQPPLPKMLVSAPEPMTKDDHIRKAREHLSIAEGME